MLFLRGCVVHSIFYVVIRFVQMKSPLPKAGGFLLKLFRIENYGVKTPPVVMASTALPVLPTLTGVAVKL